MNRIPLVAWLAALYLGLLAAEQLRPLRRPRSALRQRLKANLGLSALALGTAAVTVAPAVSAGLTLSAERDLGLLRLLPNSPTAQFIFAFLLLDVTFYYWHFANHKVPFLWRFHNAHHIDLDLDVTTSLRFHFVEVGLSAAFRAAQVVLLGVPLGALVIYEICFQANTFFHHSNVRLPLRLERALNLVLVTPRMHGIHHSQVREETNANYSVVFSWWDRLHRTLRLNIPQQVITIGVPGYARESDNRLWAALWLPFARQRPYWPPETHTRSRGTASQWPVQYLAE